MKQYLLRMLAGIFIAQFLVLAASLGYCMRHRQDCPAIGDRIDQTFTVALATVLGLFNASGNKP